MNNRSINWWCVCRVWQTVRPGFASSKSCSCCPLHGLSAAELAAQLLVNRRTVYRDIDFLSAQGVPLWQQEGRFGLNRTRYLATVRLSYQEAIALVLAGLLLARTLDERNPHVIAALRRLATTLPDIPSTHLKRAAERVEAYRPNPAQVAVLETIAEGWGQGRKVQVAYRSPRSGELRQRIIAPYALEPTASAIYVICHDEWAQRYPHLQAERGWRTPSCWTSPIPSRRTSTRKRTWPAAGGSCPASR